MEIENKTDYRERVNIWLLDNERTASWLARKCNVSPTAVKYWLDLKHTPSAKHRDMIKDITGIIE